MTPGMAVCLLLLIIIGESVYRGIKEGVLSLLAPVLAFIVALLFVHSGFDVFGNAAEKTLVNPSTGLIGTIARECYETMTNGHGLEQELLPEDSQFRQAVERETEVLKGAGAPEDEEIHNLTQNIVVFTITYLLIYLLLMAFMHVVTASIVVGGLNKIIGGVAGAFLSILKIWAFMAILSVISSFVPPLKELNEYLMQSSLYALLMRWNPIFNYI